jgi:hypothetical protein
MVDVRQEKGAALARDKRIKRVEGATNVNRLSQ